jgi:flagellar basal-body rod modification protein FlgD
VSTIEAAQAAAASVTTPATTAATTGASVTNPTGALGDDTFLQLMVAQLQDQDPMNPTNTSSYLSELAQFTSLEQETDTATSTQQLATSNQTTEALSLLGQQVNYIGTDGTAETGVVQSVDLSGSTPTLTIGGTSGIAPSQITQVS